MNDHTQPVKGKDPTARENYINTLKFMSAEIPGIRAANPSLFPNDSVERICSAARRQYDLAWGPGADRAPEDRVWSRTKQERAAPPPEPIVATPYTWRDPKTIPLRDWLYGKLLIRKFVTVSVAPGGLGKSTHVTAETLAMVSGKPLLGIAPSRPLRVWTINLEDPQDEMDRKIQATAAHYRLTSEDFNGRLFVDSGRERPLVITESTKEGTKIRRPVIDLLIAELVARGIDVLIIDPFVSSHDANENDNSAIDAIAKEWGYVADRTNCAVHLVHHVRKGEQEVTTESARGGKALTDAARVVRVFNRMSQTDGDKYGVQNHRLYYRTFIDKGNLAPPADASDWFHLISVDLGNGGICSGDNVGVTVQWQIPDPLAGVTGRDWELAAAAIRGGSWRADQRAEMWVGKAVAKALNINLGHKAEKGRVVRMVKAWVAAGSLVEVELEGEHRRVKVFVQVAETL